jgi:hypothetical protein
MTDEQEEIRRLKFLILGLEEDIEDKDLEIDQLKNDLAEMSRAQK